MLSSRTIKRKDVLNFSWHEFSVLTRKSRNFLKLTIKRLPSIFDISSAISPLCSAIADLQNKNALPVSY